MFSYSIKVRKIQKQGINLKAVVCLTVDGLMEIDAIKVISGSNGLFVSWPSHKGQVVEDGVTVDRWFNDIRFPGDEGKALKTEISDAILKEYNKSDSAPTDKQQIDTARTAAAKAQQQVNSSDSNDTNATRKPLWGF